MGCGKKPSLRDACSTIEFVRDVVILCENVRHQKETHSVQIFKVKQSTKRTIVSATRVVHSRLLSNPPLVKATWFSFNAPCIRN